jgi:hypothetical protein
MVHQEVVIQHLEEPLDLETFQRQFPLKDLMVVKQLNLRLVEVAAVERVKQILVVLGDLQILK